MKPSNWTFMFWWVAIINVGFHILADVKITSIDTAIIVLCLIGRELALLREGKR